MKRTASVFITTLFLCFSLWSKEKQEIPEIQGCPVQMVSVGAVAYGPSRYEGLYHAGVELKYKNTSDKKIKALRFEATFINGFNEEVKPNLGLENTLNVTPGKIDSYLWGKYYQTDVAKNGARVVLTKVSFDDGSVWEPSSDAPACTWKSNRGIDRWKLDWKD